MFSMSEKSKLFALFIMDLTVNQKDFLIRKKIKMAQSPWCRGTLKEMERQHARHYPSAKISPDPKILITEPQFHK